MNPFSSDESYHHTTKSVDDVTHDVTSITPVIPGSPLVFIQRFLLNNICIEK